MLLDILKALSDATRLRILALLRHGEFTVTELVELLGMGQSRISRHLKILMDAGVLAVKRQGTWGYYRLRQDNALLQALLPVLDAHAGQIEGRKQDLEALASWLERRRRSSRDFFNLHARSWDALVQELLPTEDYVPKLLSNLSACGTLVEVGAGTGRLLSELARFAEKLVAVDQSDRMLQQARSSAEAAGLKDVSYRLGEMSHLPLQDAEADALIACMVLHHAPQPQAVLAEFGRVLKPGGRLLLADLVRHEQEWVRERLLDLWLGFEPQEMGDWCRGAGFTEIRTRTMASAPGKQPVFILSAVKQAAAH